MKLNNKDKEILKGWGYTDEDIKYFDDVIDKMTFMSVTKTAKFITPATAKRILGTEEFLSGLSRAARHSSAFRYPKRYPNCHIEFEYKWW